MGIPVTIPASVLSVTQAQSNAAESIVGALGQLMQFGSTGASPNTPALLVPEPPINPTTTKSISILTANQQVFFRQLALAIVKILGFFNFSDFETPGGATLGSVSITVANAPSPVASAAVYRGTSLSALSVDKNISVSGTTITLATPIAAGEVGNVRVSYRF